MMKPAVIEVTETVCQVDWACLMEHIGSPLVWGPVLYGAIVTAVALTPTKWDDRILTRFNNVIKTWLRMK